MTIGYIYILILLFISILGSYTIFLIHKTHNKIIIGFDKSHSTMQKKLDEKTLNDTFKTHLQRNFPVEILQETNLTALTNDLSHYLNEVCNIYLENSKIINSRQDFSQLLLNRTHFQDSFLVKLCTYIKKEDIIHEERTFRLIYHTYFHILEKLESQFEFSKNGKWESKKIIFKSPLYIDKNLEIPLTSLYFHCILEDKLSRNNLSITIGDEERQLPKRLSKLSFFGNMYGRITHLVHPNSVQVITEVECR